MLLIHYGPLSKDNNNGTSDRKSVSQKLTPRRGVSLWVQPEHASGLKKHSKTQHTVRKPLSRALDLSGSESEKLKLTTRTKSKVELNRTMPIMSDWFYVYQVLEVSRLKSRLCYFVAVTQLFAADREPSQMLKRSPTCTSKASST